MLPVRVRRVFLYHNSIDFQKFFPLSSCLLYLRTLLFRIFF